MNCQFQYQMPCLLVQELSPSPTMTSPTFDFKNSESIESIGISIISPPPLIPISIIHDHPSLSSSTVLFDSDHYPTAMPSFTFHRPRRPSTGSYSSFMELDRISSSSGGALSLKTNYTNQASAVRLVNASSSSSSLKRHNRASICKKGQTKSLKSKKRKHSTSLSLDTQRAALVWRHYQHQKSTFPNIGFSPLLDGVHAGNSMTKVEEFEAFLASLSL